MRKTTRQIACPMIAGLLFVTTPTIGEDSGPPPDPAIGREALVEFVDRFFEGEMEELGVPGVGFAFVSLGDTEDEDWTSLRGYGFADLEAQEAMDPYRSVVRVGSVSKPVTALAALQLVERGGLDLHADVDLVLGEDLIPDTFDEPVTLFHLLSQTAGFAERLFGQHTVRASDHLPLHTFLERHLTSRARPPGLVINYNDHQTSLAGLMVETAAQSPFPDAAQELVLTPLGMTSTTFEQVSMPGDLESRLAKAYRTGPVALKRDYVHTTPAAGLFTTTEDMGRFVTALLSGGRGAVSANAVEAMKQTQFQHGPYMLGRGFGLAEGHTNGYRTLHKDGQCSGFTARILLVPELRVGWFSVQNLSIFGRAGAIGRVNGLHRRLASALLEEFWPEGPGPEIPRPATAAEPSKQSHLESLAGTYRDTMDPTKGWEGLLLANQVKVEARPDGTLRFLGLEPWVESTPTTFFYQQGEATAIARFVETRDGTPNWVTFRAGAWERLPWYRTRRFTMAALGVSLLVSVSALIALAWSRRRTSHQLPFGARLLGASASLLLLFISGLGLAMMVTDVQILYSGVTPLLRVTFLLPPLALLLALVGLARLVLSNRSSSERSGGSRPGLAQTGYWAIVGLAVLGFSTVLALNSALGWPL